MELTTSPAPGEPFQLGQEVTYTVTITTVVDSGHAGASNLSAVFVASYTDTPEDPNVPPLTGSDEVVLVPNP